MERLLILMCSLCSVVLARAAKQKRCIVNVDLLQQTMQFEWTPCVQHIPLADRASTRTFALGFALIVNVEIIKYCLGLPE